MAAQCTQLDMSKNLEKHSGIMFTIQHESFQASIPAVSHAVSWTRTCTVHACLCASGQVQNLAGSVHS